MVNKTQPHMKEAVLYASQGVDLGGGFLPPMKE